MASPLSAPLSQTFCRLQRACQWNRRGRFAKEAFLLPLILPRWTTCYGACLKDAGEDPSLRWFSFTQRLGQQECELGSCWMGLVGAMNVDASTY